MMSVSAATKRIVVPKNKHTHPSLIQFNTLLSTESRYGATSICRDSFRSSGSTNTIIDQYQSFFKYPLFHLQNVYIQMA